MDSQCQENIEILRRMKNGKEVLIILNQECFMFVDCGFQFVDKTHLAIVQTSIYVSLMYNYFVPVMVFHSFIAVSLIIFNRLQSLVSFLRFSLHYFSFME